MVLWEQSDREKYWATPAFCFCLHRSCPEFPLLYLIRRNPWIMVKSLNIILNVNLNVFSPKHLFDDQSFWPNEISFEGSQVRWWKWWCVLEFMFIVLKEEVTTNFPLAHKQASKTNWDIQTIIVVGCKKVVKRHVFVRILGWWWWQKTFRPVTGYLRSVSRIVTISIRCQTKSLGGWQTQFFMAHVHKFQLLVPKSKNISLFLELTFPS